MDTDKILQINENSSLVIDLTTANSRFSKSWITKPITWGKLVNRLSKPTITQETQEEYRRMPKAQKDKVKDVGGFVGGAIRGKQRLNTAVKNRSLITLDIDDVVQYTADDIWNTYLSFLGCEAVMYSTHSSTARHPRLRLIIPTDREMTPDEYEPVARKIAELSFIDLDSFDDTTYEVSRLMYWPSCSRDAKFFFKHKAGALISVDSILEKYDDWRDTEEWPTSTRQDEIIKRAKDKQEDPLEKKGLVGAFCRTYTISDAISTFLSDVYEEARDGRFTYKKGTTFGGLVIYENKFAYSHHGTDPISGQLCNAFDLVRLHKYGNLDTDAKRDTPVNRLPSYLKMIDDITDDERVSAQLVSEQQESVVEDFDFSEDPKEWTKKVKFNKKGEIYNTISNIVLILDNDPNIKGKFIYDEFANRAIVDTGVPWGKRQRKHDWQDLDDSGLYDYLEKVYKLSSMQKVEDAKNLVFDRNKVHPVKEYLENLPRWDRKSRIEKLFSDYLGAEDNIYTREAAKVHFTASVKRIYEPGCKYDTMVILAGKQGLGKSTFIRKISKDWFSDSVYTIKGKEAAELIQGVWHIELGEMSAMRKSDRDAVKAFLSKQNDIYRVAYAKNTTRFPRQCVFWGTSNEYNFLRDPTGDRRSFPIDCGTTKPTLDIFNDLDEEIDQIWAEAVYLYKVGHRTYLAGEALELSIKAQEEHKEDTPWRGVIEEYLEKWYPANWDELPLHERRNYIKGESSGFDSADLSKDKIKLDRVCALQIWCELFDGKKQNLSTTDTMKINDILISLSGWERVTTARFNGYGTQRGFKRICE
ncbi:MAG: virulence-associated E family protein [Clostridia bacterium]|nr:virulence-associated E family protein [Clostridia bacterium]